MVYAVSNGAIAVGLILTASMALGMVTTIAAFAIGAVLFRDRFFQLLAMTDSARERIGQAVEVIGATAIIGLGLWLLSAVELGTTSMSNHSHDHHDHHHGH